MIAVRNQRIIGLGDKNIIDKFKNLNCDILFASEINCWPDKNLANKFDEIHTETRYKYLNSWLYIGTVKHLKYIMQKPIENNEDDQLYFQNRFLENLETQEIVIKLDCDNYIFQCLSGIGDTVGVLFKGILINIDTCCCPLVVHGNGGPQDKFFFDKLFRKFESRRAYAHRTFDQREIRARQSVL